MQRFKQQGLLKAFTQLGIMRLHNRVLSYSFCYILMVRISAINRISVRQGLFITSNMLYLIRFKQKCFFYILIAVKGSMNTTVTTTHYFYYEGKFYFW